MSIKNITVIEEFDITDALCYDNYHGYENLADIIAIEDDIATYAKVKVFKWNFEYTVENLDTRYATLFRMMSEWSHYDEDNSAIVNYAYRGGPVTEIWLLAD